MFTGTFLQSYRYRRLLENVKALSYLEQSFNVKLDTCAVNLLIKLGEFKDLQGFILEQDYWKEKQRLINLTWVVSLREFLEECNWHCCVIVAGDFKSSRKFDAEAAIDKIDKEVQRLTNIWEFQYCPLAVLELTIDSLSD